MRVAGIGREKWMAVRISQGDVERVVILPGDDEEAEGAIREAILEVEGAACDSTLR